MACDPDAGNVPSTLENLCVPVSNSDEGELASASPPPTTMNFQGCVIDNMNYNSIQPDPKENPVNSPPEPNMAAPDEQNLLDVYPNGEGQPKVLIINNWEFEGDVGNVPGYKIDVEKLKKMWKDLGCLSQVEENMTIKKMEKCVCEFSKAKNLTTMGQKFCAVFILSHGSEGDVVMGKSGQKLSIEKLLGLFDNKNVQLRGMPKLFFFQASRGDHYNQGIVSPAGPRGRHIISHGSDILVAHSCQPNNMSYVHNEDGSFFIQDIIEVFTSNAGTTHVLDMMTMVNDKAAKRTISCQIDDNGPVIKDIMCMSEFRSTLRKQLFLKHNAQS